MSRITFFKYLPEIIKFGFISLLITVLPIYIIDSLYFESSTLAPLNLVVYNVFAGDGRGPDLYGTEPWWFYLANMFLNFNIGLIFAILSIPLLVLNLHTQRFKPTSCRLPCGLINEQSI